jgi:integrase
MRQPSPWFWDQKQVWCFTLNRKRRRIGPNPKGPAPRKNSKGQWIVPQGILDDFYKLMGHPSAVASSDTSWAILDTFLTWVEANRPASYPSYKKCLQLFKDAVPNMRVTALKPYHIQQWLDEKKKWSDGYKRGIITVIKRAFNWSVKSGHLVTSPVASLVKPEGKSRDQLISPAEFKKIVSLGKDENFRDLLKVVWWSGMRPQEICRIEARHLKDGFIEFEKLESKGKRDERQVFLTDEALKLCQKWAKKNPSGPIFRNTRGNQWTAFAFSNRFARMQEELGFKVAMYAFRHSFAHHAITTGGLSLEETAALMGHRSTQQVYQRYGKLKKNKAFMREAAKRAISSGGA